MEKFENKPYPEFKDGMEFTVVDPKHWRAVISEGSIITLFDQDNSACPQFECDGGRRLYLHWDRLAPLEQKGASCNPLDSQVGGDHYKKYKIQPLEYIHANKMGMFEGSIVKYATRWRDKGGVQDLEKIKHLVDVLIELEGDNP